MPHLLVSALCEHSLERSRRMRADVQTLLCFLVHRLHRSVRPPGVPKPYDVVGCHARGVDADGRQAPQMPFVGRRQGVLFIRPYAIACGRQALRCRPASGGHGPRSLGRRYARRVVPRAHRSGRAASTRARRRRGRGPLWHIVAREVRPRLHVIRVVPLAAAAVDYRQVPQDSLNLLAVLLHAHRDGVADRLVRHVRHSPKVSRQ
mmetsp:Transcript_36889/g.106219  ORF Transcript_36889/g.106219 Transcript_36889/m.106219 type:complete len:205 (+) Transcript_36889:324-938(+)